MNEEPKKNSQQTDRGTNETNEITLKEFFNVKPIIIIFYLGWLLLCTLVFVLGGFSRYDYPENKMGTDTFLGFLIIPAIVVYIVKIRPIARNYISKKKKIGGENPLKTDKKKEVVREETLTKKMEVEKEVKFPKKIDLGQKVMSNLKNELPIAKYEAYKYSANDIWILLVFYTFILEIVLVIYDSTRDQHPAAVAGAAFGALLIPMLIAGIHRKSTKKSSTQAMFVLYFVIVAFEFMAGIFMSMQANSYLKQNGNIKYRLSDYSGACVDWNKAGELGIKQAYDRIKEYCR